MLQVCGEVNAVGTGWRSVRLTPFPEVILGWSQQLYPGYIHTLPLTYFLITKKWGLFRKRLLLCPEVNEFSRVQVCNLIP